MLGCPDSRYDLGVYDVKKGKYDKAKKHFIIIICLPTLDMMVL